MSKCHILDSDNNQSYTVVIHFATPTGNNTVGLSWKACAIANGNIGTTILKVGTDPGDTTQTEYDNIIAGDVVEIVRTATVGTSPTNAMIESLADIYITEWQNAMTRILKYYGHIITGS